MLRKLFLAAACVGMFAAPALAQSTCPTIVPGAVLTAGQWNQCFQNKQDALGFTPVNKIGDTMAGRLATVASNVSRSGFAILPGTAPASPADGDLWTTTLGVFARVNGTTVGPFSATGSTVPSVVQGDLLYGSAAVTISTLPKNTSTTRYLSNGGTNNNPLWAQVDLGTGVTGALPLAGIATGTQDTLLGYFSSTTASAATLSNCVSAITYSTSTHTFGCNVGTGSGTVTSAGFLNTYGLSVSGSPITNSGSISAGVALLSLTSSLSSPVLLNNTAAYFDGPSIAQGVTGTWLATGTVTIGDSVVAAVINCKLWDGTTLMASGQIGTSVGGNVLTMSLSGLIISPAANIRISCKDISSTNGVIVSSNSGNPKDSTLTGVRIQ